MAQERKTAKLNLAKNQAGWQGLEAKIDEARANLEKLKSDYQRNKKLFAKEAISESKLDNLEAQQEKVEIEADKLEVKLGQLDIKQKLLEKDLQKAQLGVKLAEDGLEEAKIKLCYSNCSSGRSYYQ